MENEHDAKLIQQATAVAIEAAARHLETKADKLDALAAELRERLSKYGFDGRAIEGYAYYSRKTAGEIRKLAAPSGTANADELRVTVSTGAPPCASPPSWTQPPMVTQQGMPASTDPRSIQDVLRLHVTSSESMRETYVRTFDADGFTYQRGMTDGLKRAIEVADYRDAHGHGNATATATPVRSDELRGDVRFTLAEISDSLRYAGEGTLNYVKHDLLTNDLNKLLVRKMQQTSDTAGEANSTPVRVEQREVGDLWLADLTVCQTCKRDMLSSRHEIDWFGRVVCLRAVKVPRITSGDEK